MGGCVELNEVSAGAVPLTERSDLSKPALRTPSPPPAGSASPDSAEPRPNRSLPPCPERSDRFSLGSRQGKYWYPDWSPQGKRGERAAIKWAGEAAGV